MRKNASRWSAVAVAALCSVSAAAQEKRFGAWTVGVMAGNGGAFAATTNDSGGLLGLYCYRDGGKCLWLLKNDIGCDDGSKYPVLVNSDSGAASTEIVCLKLGGKPRYAFADFDTIDSTVRMSDWIGFAFPLRSGRFQVSRFPLDGASRALEFMHRLMKKAAEDADRGTRDQTF
jgi:hypothetical protein